VPLDVVQETQRRLERGAERARPAHRHRRRPFQYPSFAEDQRARLRFTDAWRYRLGSTNDEGWFRGQCRFSKVAPKWGEFYEVTGDLLLNKCPADWQYMMGEPDEVLRHFLFYLRDETFECDARGYVLDLNACM